MTYKKVLILSIVFEYGSLVALGYLLGWKPALAIFFLVWGCQLELKHT